MRSQICAVATLLVTTLLCPALCAAQESRLGRLFYSAEERAQLDKKRGVVIPVQTGPQTSIVNGIITRSGEAPILFIDGKETRGAATRASAQQQLNQGVPLKSESGQTFAAQPGQIVDLSTGKAVETYQFLPGQPGAAEAAPAEPGATPGPSRAMQPAAQSAAPARTPASPPPR